MFDIAHILFPTHRPFAAAAAALLLGGAIACATAGGGRASANGVYTAPTGHFTVQFPRTLFGGRTQEGESDDGRWVEYLADDGAVWRIEYYSIPTSADSAFLTDSTRRDGFTRGFFHDVVAPDYEQRAPGATTLHSQFVTDSVGRAYFAVMRLPGMSAAMTRGPEGFRRDDAIMHFLLFQRNEWFYLLKVVPSPTFGNALTDPDLSPQRALDFRKRIVFRDPRVW